MEDSCDATHESKALIQQIANKLQDGAFGSFSPSIYDTAWVALIRVPGAGHKWLFPECFEYLLGTQSSDGGWTANRSAVDRILNTLASMVALEEHRTVAEETDDHATSRRLHERFLSAEDFLKQQLNEWDVASSVHVGTEVLVPALLETLEKDGKLFAFPGRALLAEWNRRKLRKFSPDMLYCPRKTTLVHSMEAFVGKIDFDRVSHHLDSRGSLMGSPAATAAYLMNASSWSEAAESYIRTVVESSRRNGYSGGVPGAFPSSIFESAWVVSTLVRSNPSPAITEFPAVHQIRAFLGLQFDSHDGLLGFDTGLLEDVDDTAKCILTLTLLGANPNPKSMIGHYEDASHFRTYFHEANGSFSANCNVLDALLHSIHPAAYLSQVNKIAQFLCRTFDSGSISDKWNLCETYSLMLLSQAFVTLVKRWDEDVLGEMPQELISEKIPIVLFTIMTRTLQTQQNDGSWVFGTASRETTAYAVLTLKALGSLPWFSQFQTEIDSAINNGWDYLATHRDHWDLPEHLWVAKVTYALPTVSRAYIIAALSPIIPFTWTPKVRGLVDLPSERVEQVTHFFSTLPMFSQDKVWIVKGDVALGMLYYPNLSRAVSSIFPQPAQAVNKYLEYIPFTWIATNRKQEFPLSNTVLVEMMMVSVQTYRLDEFIETLDNGDATGESNEDIRHMLKRLCQFPADIPQTNGESQSQPCSGDAAQKTCQSQVEECLLAFTSQMFGHPAVRQSPEGVRRQFHRKLTQCMLAHIDHEEDNRRFAAQRRRTPSRLEKAIYESAQLSYYDWVQEVSSRDIQSPSIFLFFCCLLAPAGQSFFVGVRQNYFAEALSQHLAALCRQYNDYGSASRDEAEGNLNSLNFPEFSQSGDELQRQDKAAKASQTADSYIRDKAAMKADLLQIAEYERECLNSVSEKLRNELYQSRGGEWRFRALKVYIETVDLYGQIYVARDISNRVK
ncbi:ent-kaurene synthase [Xylariaceae sp. FL0594]|nr:ent-kaurene synthase [Xylariaceae sp. FL0594]